ncbi:hypothetical protein HMPREF0580_0466 [Mobiluncus mulieris ATCC 35239]|uniref:Uncharacterized protein n=1 Tax=Mobiluncus mulieris ATCC 35239 TaxID=871571 RepID=E0QNK2_9ACTO|nr:hypothetical protein [Mobiluncus mulieris]EEJ52799.1 hypothetical protein HMPREF0577_2112 [Mobiluncus mulieris ATCC 35243]EFM46974.1 hypothetical protein HMPREF0580_0466 [Mobiluncus mulieris ATCC 35239]NMX18696.1 hypothetical protein [Mobiluncus mulieris]
MKYAARLRLRRLGCFGGDSKSLLSLTAFASYGGVMRASPARRHAKQ